MNDLELLGRQRYISGLRILADVLEKHGEVPLPYDGTDSDLAINHFLCISGAREALAAAARAFPCRWRKEAREYEDGTAYYNLRGELDGLRIRLTAFRDAVCTRVVTGTREVTETVRDPEALAAVPEVEVTRIVEDVEWVCESVLAPRSAPAGDAGPELAGTVAA